MRPLRFSAAARFLLLTLCSAALSAVIAAPAAGAVRGTVIDADGKPVAGARVSLFAFEPPEARFARLMSEAPEPVPSASTQTDPKGNFAFDSPRIASELRVFLRGFAPLSLRVEPDEDAGAIVLARAEMKSGSVTSGGKPVAGAVVSIEYEAEYVTRTDENGRYEAPDLRSASSISVYHRDYAPDAESFSRRSGGKASELQRVLVRGSARTGRIVAADGRSPVAAAVVEVDGWPLATSAEDGSFTIAHMPAKWTMLLARKDNFIGQRAFLASGDLPVRMAPAAQISGRVIDRKTRMPLAGAVVDLASGTFGGKAPGETSTVTDAKGLWSIRALPGTWRLVVEHPGYTSEDAEAAAAAGQKVSKELGVDPLARVTGRILDDGNRPLAGAKIDVDEQFRMSRGRMMRLPSARSAPDGRYAIRLSTEDEVRLRATKKGLPFATSDLLRLTPGEKRGGVDLVIPAGVEVTGRVTDRNGDPIGGVLVSTSETPADGRRVMIRRVIGRGPGDDESLVATGRDGTFSLRVKEGTYDFTFKRDGYAPRAVRGHVVALSGTQPVETSLDPSVEISGRIMRNGAPVEGIALYAFDPMTDASATSDADGAFTLSGLTAGSVRVGLRNEAEFIEEQRTLTAPARDVVIELAPGERVSGRVLEKGTRRPVTAFQAGISVSRSGGGMVMVAPPLLKSFTSDDGSFVLENVPLGSINLVASAPGYTDAKLNLTLERGKPIEGVTLELDSGIRLTGRVTGPTGAALADVSVRVTPGQGGGFNPMMDRSTSTDSNGEYTIDTLETGDGTVEFSHPKYLSATKSVSLKGRETRLDAQLEAGLRVSGIVVDPAGVPVAEANVTARGGDWDSVQSRSDGTFDFESMEPGRYTFSASHTGYAEGRVEDYDVSSGAPLRIVLRTGGTIYGHVGGLAPKELEYASVEVRGPRSSTRATVDSSGNYRVEGVDPGTVRVAASVSSRGFGAARTSPVQTVEISAGSSQQVDIDFPGDTVISGRVLRNGTPLQGAMVQFTPRTAGTQTTASASSNQDGDYSVTGLQEGDYTVHVIDVQRFSPYSTTYQVRGSDTFDIEYDTASVRGTVVDAATGETISGAQVQLRPAGTSESPRMTRAATSDAAGNFIIDDTPAAAYSISASREGYASTPADLVVGDAPVNGIEVRMSKTDGVRLRIVDARDGHVLRALITVQDAQGRVVYDGRMSFGMDTSDEVRIPLPPGTYYANVGAGGYAVRSVTVSSPGAQTIALSRGGSLVIESKHSTRRRARLLDSSGRVYEINMRPGGLIDLNPQPGLTTVDAVAPGSYTLALLSEDESSVEASVPVVVQEGQAAKVSL